MRQVALKTTNNLSYNTQIDVSYLSEGLYNVTIITNNKTINKKLIIKS